MEKDRKRSRKHYDAESSPDREKEKRVVWEEHRSSLDKLFFFGAAARLQRSPNLWIFNNYSSSPNGL